MRGSGRLALAGMLALVAGGLHACRTDYVEKGDLAALSERGRLRILIPSRSLPILPRHDYPIDQEQELAERLAASLGLEAEVVEMQERDRLIEALVEGRGDLALARLTVTPERAKRLDFSAPLDSTREVLVVRREDALASLAELAGRRVAVRRSASFHQTLLRLQGEIPGLGIELVPESLDTEQILDGVARGAFEATVADADLLEKVLEYRDDLRAAFPLSEPRPIAWAMRRGSPELKAAVDRFLQQEALTGDLDPILLGDLPEIRRRRVLRVLTRNNAATTFIHRGEQVGFEFELVREFARSIGCRLEVVIPPGFSDLVPWLLEGRGDLIAASFVATEPRREALAFTRPYLRVPQLVVTRADDPLRSLRGLAGRRVAVRPSSVYRGTLEALQQRGVALTIEPVAESLETEELIAGVAEGVYDTTVALEHLLEIELAFRSDVRGALAVGAPVDVAWGVRPADVELRGAADAFLAANARGSTFFNILERRYLRDPRQVARRAAERPRASGRISPWDELFRKHGAEHGIDWRLLAALAFEESRFEPSAESWAGAVGLTQILPSTARGLGLRGDLTDPDTAIRGAALYLRRLSDEHYGELPIGERLRFALAGYHAGPGHVLDGRRIAREKGLDDRVWFDNVERALPLLSRQAYASRARSGYCRCWATVRYVDNVHQRYRRYVAVVQ